LGVIDRSNLSLAKLVDPRGTYRARRSCVLKISDHTVLG